jgi:hypothetical protein
MINRPSLVLSLLVALIAVPAVSAVSAYASSSRSETQQPSSTNDAWAHVQQIAQGVELQVEPTRGSSVRGRFISATDTTLSLYMDKKVFELQRDTIRRIHAVGSRSRSRSALVGAGVGLGSGVGVGLLVLAGSDRTSGANLSPVSFGFVGTVAGAVIGVLRGGKHRGPLLYERK